MGDKVFCKYQSLYGKAREILLSWDATQALALALISNAANVIERLPALTAIINYGNLQAMPEVAEAVLSKQMESLESTLQRMQAQLTEFMQYCLQLERIAQEGRQFLQGIHPAPPMGGCTRRGASPSIAECQEGLDDLWHMHRDEWAVKKELIAAIRWDSSEAELSQIQIIFRAQPNIPPDCVQLKLLALQSLE
mmetsp:Transcript_29330/g.56297  ORF Transcript_29330/g.56297 Transcript_29330/m.56297 type:complete len:194 (+) Transcript_29330:384-965(+)|eukprot:CAMPEP_0114311308 /NCGR_PEP_ID=MMETSP0059-20121206/19749_1 /TAXON_ID=36894 /ORGANISM="Pyramimonas parkeae, Strain CCMP726" /LENGTH=193 /DNA_ID=CAMNT_0001435461 /DNA_START=302 /DNA_END=883 /DNA_ORIENTATION=-